MKYKLLLSSWCCMLIAFLLSLYTQHGMQLKIDTFNNQKETYESIIRMFCKIAKRTNQEVWYNK